MKKIVGIIAEYNPFHRGHAYHIKKAKELANADCTVVLLSGDFVQRGAPAILPKHTRAKMALLGGADIVLELPSFYASSSAEYFARGAVGIFHALGCIDALCFGSEEGTITPCMETAKILVEEPTAFQNTLKEHLKSGLSFPSARKAALLVCYQKQSSLSRDEHFLDSPNNILGIEYCKALLSLNSAIEPITVKREGSSYHAQELTDSYPSTSAIRQTLAKPSQTEFGQATSDSFDFSLSALWKQVQPEAVAAFSRNFSKEDFLTEDDFSLLLKYKLMSSTPQTLCQAADMSPELAQRILNCLNEFRSFSQFAALLKTKELTRTRINRALLHVLLDISADLPSRTPGYVRLLGFNKNASGFLKTVQKSASLPLLTKAADYKRLLPKEEVPVFEKDIFVSNLYQSVLNIKKQTAFTHDLQKPPVIL